MISFDVRPASPKGPGGGVDRAAIATLMLERAGKELHPELTRNFLGLLKRQTV